MAAFREQVVHLLRIDVISLIVEDHDARSATLRVVKFPVVALVETYVFPQYGQMSRGDRRTLSIESDYHAVKVVLVAQGIEVLQKTYEEGGLARTVESAYNAREWALKFEIVSHRGVHCS